MRKIICLITALLVCLGIVAPAYAVEGDFVPSITYKDGLDARTAKMDGEDVSECVVVTSIKEAKERTTDIKQEERDLLLDVYDQLSSGEMVLPLDGDYVIRELVDVSFEYEDCRNKGTHNEKAKKLKQEGVTLTVDFDFEIDSFVDLQVLAYVDGEWQFAKDVKINTDGTVTVELEDICPVAFCVDSRGEELPPQTGDTIGGSLLLWFALVIVSAIAIVVLMVNRRKIAR